MAILGRSPYSWADEISGWVTLHGHERKALLVMMQSFKSPELEELEIEIVKGGGKKKFFRLYVENLSLAYEVLNMARVSGW